MEKKRAVILLSGGIDSATTLAVARERNFALFVITFSYGQRHSIEVSFARMMAEFFKVENQIVIDLPVELFSMSSLSSVSAIEVPKKDLKSDCESIPTTYVPGRNILFLSYALSYAENIGSRNIFIGVNSIDYSGYPDCRPEFIKAFETMANSGTKAGIMGDRFAIEAPLMYMKKSEIIKLGASLNVDYSLTHSCYDPVDDRFSCGKCDSCIIRRKGFLEAGIPDPTNYNV